MATGRRAVRLVVEGIPEEELCVQGRGWKPPGTTPRLCERASWTRVSHSADTEKEYLGYDHKLLRVTLKME